MLLEELRRGPGQALFGCDLVFGVSGDGTGHIIEREGVVFL